MSFYFYLLSGFRSIHGWSRVCFFQTEGLWTWNNDYFLSIVFKFIFNINISKLFKNAKIQFKIKKLNFYKNTFQQRETQRVPYDYLNSNISKTEKKNGKMNSRRHAVLCFKWSNKKFDSTKYSEDGPLNT
jgi:hypothetical protein